MNAKVVPELNEILILSQWVPREKKNEITYVLYWSYDKKSGLIERLKWFQWLLGRKPKEKENNFFSHNGSDANQKQCPELGEFFQMFQRVARKKEREVGGPIHEGDNVVK